VNSWYQNEFTYDVREITAKKRIGVEYELNFDLPYVSKDFSLVVWSTKQPVFISHDDGYESDRFPDLIEVPESTYSTDDDTSKEESDKDSDHTDHEND
jgi:hypothetical protein